MVNEFEIDILWQAADLGVGQSMKCVVCIFGYWVTISAQNSFAGLIILFTGTSFGVDV